MEISRILLYEIRLVLIRNFNFLPQHKPLKMSSSEFSDVFERTR